MSRRPVRRDEARTLADLETILAGAMEAEAWAQALRAVELLGKHIGLWKSDTAPRTSLADMIIEAAKAGDDEPPP